MRVRYFVVVGLVFFLIGCGRTQPELLIDSFEGDLNEETVDFGASDGSSLTIAAEKDLKIDGAQSLKVVYDLKPSGYMWVARGFNLDVKGADRWLVKPDGIKWRNYDSFNFDLHGDPDGGMIAVDIKDAGGEVWRFLIDGKFEGWKAIACPFKLFFARDDWQPQSAEKNGVMDFPIMSFQFEPRLPGQGVYYFDGVNLSRLAAKK